MHIITQYLLSGKPRKTIKNGHSSRSYPRKWKKEKNKKKKKQKKTKTKKNKHTNQMVFLWKNNRKRIII